MLALAFDTEVMKQLYGKCHYFDFTQYKGTLDFNTSNGHTLK